MTIHIYIFPINHNTVPPLLWPWEMISKNFSFYIKILSGPPSSLLLRIYSIYQSSLQPFKTWLLSCYVHVLLASIAIGIVRLELRHIWYIFRVPANNRMRDFNDIISFKVGSELGKQCGILKPTETNIKGNCMSRDRNDVLRAQWWLEPWRRSWPPGAVVMVGQSHPSREGAGKNTLAYTSSHFQISCQGLLLAKPNLKPEGVET